MRAQWNYPQNSSETVALVLSIVGLVFSVVMLVYWLVYYSSHPEILQQMIDMARQMQRR